MNDRTDVLRKQKVIHYTPVGLFWRQMFIRESVFCFLRLVQPLQPFARITTPRIWRNSRKLFSKASIMIRMAKYRGKSWRWSFWLWPKCPRMNNKFEKAPSRKAEFGANVASVASDRFFSLSSSLTSLLSHFEHAVKLHFKSLACSMSRHENNRSLLFESADDFPRSEHTDVEECWV